MLSNSEAVRMAAVEELEAHRAERPRITRVIVDDATPEAVTSHMAEQGGAIAGMSAESAILSNTAGSRYSDAPKMDPLLYGHAGDRLTVDRKGRVSECIERACLTLCLMVQRHVIRDLGASPGFIARGGAARLLTSFPDDMLGRRRIDVDPVPAALSDEWAGIITRIVTCKPSSERGSYVPWTLSLAEGAKAAFREYRAWHEPQMSEDGAFGDIRDWAGKQCGAVLRIAGLLHVAAHETPENVPISVDTLQRAISVVDYYAEHARIMYRMMSGRSGQSDARTVLAAIKTLDNPTTRREVHRKLHNRIAFASSDDLEPSLVLLEGYGYIKRDNHTGVKGGRPSELIHLNPSEPDDKTDATHFHHVQSRGSVGSVTGFPSPETKTDPSQRSNGFGEEAEPPPDTQPTGAEELRPTGAYMLSEGEI